MTIREHTIERDVLLKKGIELDSPLSTFRIFLYKNRKFTLLTKYPDSRLIEIYEYVAFNQGEDHYYE